MQIYSDWAAFSEYERAFNLRDTYGAKSLVDQGRVTTVLDAPSCLVLESKICWTFSDLGFRRFIRILDGEYATKAGWVLDRYLEKPHY